MSSPAVIPDLDYVDHPSLGRLSFPKDMPPDERNVSIVRMMAQQKTGLSPALRQLSPAGAKFFRNQQPGVESPDEQGEPSTPEDRAKNAAYDQLPMSTKAKLLFMPGAMDEWSKQFYGNKLDPHGSAAALGSVLEPTVGKMAEGSADVLEGKVAQGGHKFIEGASTAALPLMARGAVSSPLTALKAIIGGYAVGKGAKLGSAALGANPDQQQLAEDLGNIGGGTLGSGLEMSPDILAKLKAVGSVGGQYAISKVPVAGGVVRRPSYMDLIEALRAKAPAAAEIPSLSTTAREVRGPYQPVADTSVTPSGNVDLPPERSGGTIRTVQPEPISSTATATVRPAQITPENLLEQLRKGAADKHGNTPQTFDVNPPATEPGFNDATQTYIRPSKMGTKQGIEDMLAAAKAGEPTASRVDAHKVAKTAIGEQVSSTPDAVIYGDKGMNTPAQEYFIQKMRSGLETPTVTGEAEQNQLQQMMNAYAKSGTYKPQSFFKQYPAPEMPPGASPSEVRAASSPNPPRSSLVRNQKQLANFKNSLSDVAQFQEQASQELFGKSFNDLPVNDPASRLKATMRAIELQVQARRAK